MRGPRRVRGQDVEGERQAQIDRGLVERIVHRMVVIFVLRVAGHHHADEAHFLGALQIRDAFPD
jgi:hypothetical protein